MSVVPKWATLIIAFASLALLSAPAAAAAAVTSEVVGSTLTVSGDGEADTITLTVADDEIAVDGVKSGLDQGPAADILVDTGGGANVVDAGALAAENYRSLTIEGGAAHDVITGGAGDDTVKGGAGDDQLIGFKGEDTVLGGEGGDVMLWNLGDGTDEDSGDAGFDEVVVNGDPIGSDSFFFKPSSTPGRVRVSATFPAPFSIEFAAEALAVDGLGGSDFVGPEGSAGLQGQIQLTINGGDGDDQLNGSDGADIIAGEEGSDLIFGEGGSDQVLGGTGSDQLFGDDGGDVIFGEGGDDRLLGGAGRDFVNDGEGDDVNVWNEGDGDDLLQGEAGFDRFEASGSPTAGDQFQIADHGAITTFERTNLDPTKIELEGFANEAISVNGVGGNDELVVSPGLPQLAVTADGGPGTDKLTGAEEEDGFVGGPGNDTLDLGGGSDIADGEGGEDQLDGGDGEDRLMSRDETPDVVHGGPGVDSAQTDPVTVDQVDGVENLDTGQPPLEEPPGQEQPNQPPAGARPAAADTSATLPAIGPVALAKSGKRLIAKVPIFCPASETGGCRTTLTLETARAVHLGGRKAVLVLGSKTVDLGPGARMNLQIRLSRATAALAKHGRLAARLRIASSDAAGNTATRTAAVTLKIPRP